MDASISSICAVMKNMGLRRQAFNAGEEIPKFQCKPIKRTSSVIKMKSYQMIGFMRKMKVL